MAILPAYDDFSRAFDAGENQVVYARLTADLEVEVAGDYECVDDGQVAVQRYQEISAKCIKTAIQPGRSATDGESS